MGFSLGEMLTEIENRANEKGIETDMREKNIHAEMAAQQIEAEKAAEEVKLRDAYNRERHLNNPFYKRVDKLVEEVAKEQVLKGADKYPEPFNPKSWTGKQLIRHGLQEARDLQVYLVGALDHIERVEADYARMKKERDRFFFENEHLISENRKAAELFNNEVNKYCQLDNEYNGLMKDHAEVSKDLDKHKKAIVEVAVAFSKEVAKFKNENAELKTEIERINKLKEITNIHINTNGPVDIEKFKNIIDKEMGDANNHI